MAITVIVSRNHKGDVYAHASAASLRDGHLILSRIGEDGQWEEIAAYAPGQWSSWSLDDARTRES
jgi:hypothetical protein